MKTELTVAIKHIANEIKQYSSKGGPLDSQDIFILAKGLKTLVQSFDMLPEEVKAITKEELISDVLNVTKTKVEDKEYLKPEIIKKATKEPSLGALRAAKIANDIDKAKPVKVEFSTPFDEPFTPKKKSNKWTTGELQLIRDIMLPDTAKSRQTLEYISKKLPERTQSSIRSKLHSLGIVIHKGVLYRGNNYES